MDTTPPELRAEPHPLSPTGTVLLAIALGLCGGYLDLVAMIFRKYCWNDLRYFWSGSDFPGACRSCTRSCWRLWG